jgi:hypothetical protein
MTEAEWLAATDPRTLIDWLFFDARVTDRKLRLFSVAGCEPLRRLVGDPRLLAALDSAEAFADGHIDAATLRAVHDAAWENLRARHERVYGKLSDEIRGAEIVCLYPTAQDPHRNRDRYRADDDAPYALLVAMFIDHPRTSAHFPRLACLLHDIFGNPFHPPPPLPPLVLAWNDGTVRRLAEAVYEERQLPAGTLDTGRLAILADALLDAGCEDEDLIQHCRSERPHVRGCWAVDAILGKS